MFSSPILPVSSSDPLDDLYKLDPLTAGLPDGIAAAHAFAPEDWKAAAWRALRTLAQAGEAFDVDTLRRLGVPNPDTYHRWGSVLAAARRSGFIKWAGLAEHTAPNGAGVPVRRWRGTEKATAVAAWDRTPAAGPNPGAQR